LQPPGVCHWCDLYRTHDGYRALWDQTPAPPAPPPPAGPGTELKAILAEYGITPQSGCQCNSRAAHMDEWGPDGCRARRAEIIDWLRGEWDQLGWLDKVKAAARAISNGFIHPVDPIGSLVDLAIARAETKAGKPDDGGQ
jgi:hypothetical protein